MNLWTKISKSTTRWDPLILIASLQFVVLGKLFNNFTRRTFLIIFCSLLFWLIFFLISLRNGSKKSKGEIAIYSAIRNISIYLIVTGILIVHVGYTPMLVVVVYLIFCLISVVYIFMNLFRRNRINIEIQESDYIAGFYFNINNENLTVPRWRYGVGTTVNFIRPETWLILIIIIFAPILARIVTRQ